MIFLEKQHHDMRTIAVVLFSFFLPLFPRIATWIVVVWFVAWLLSGQVIKYRSAYKQKGLWPILILFLLYLAGLAWSDYPDIGARELETKLSLFVFPLLFFVGPRNQQTTLFPIRVSFILGCSLAMVICLLVAGFNYFVNGVFGFTYKDLGAPLHFHPTYFALYLNFGIILATDVWLRGKDSRFFYRMFILVSLFFVFLLAARMQLLLIVLIGLGWFFWRMVKQGKILRGLLQAMAALTLLSAIVWTIPTTRNRVNRAITEFSSPQPEDRNIRIELWAAAKASWTESPVYGYGTGSAMPALEQQYRERGCEDCLDGPLNAHNQYLQTAVELGWIGLLFLMGCLLFPILMKGPRQRLLLLFLLLFALSNITESMLATQRGAMFFGFFYAFFLWNSTGEQFSLQKSGSD